MLGRKGCLEKMNNYWDVGQFLSVTMLANNAGKSIQAAEKLFKLKPPVWWVMSVHYHYPSQYQIMSWNVSSRVERYKCKKQEQLLCSSFWLLHYSKIRAERTTLRDHLVLCEWRERQTYAHTEYIPTYCIYKIKLCPINFFKSSRSSRTKHSLIHIVHLWESRS